MIERANVDRAPLERLLAAVQAFSNDLANSPEQVGVVTQALLVWEEVSYDEDGEPLRSTIYAGMGDQITPTGSLGLAVHLLGTLKRDVIGDA